MKRLTALLLSLLFVCPTIAHAVEKGFTVRYGDRESPRIAITVDDCFYGDAVQTAFDLAQKYQVPFTFFMVGGSLKDEDQAMWREIVDAGCEIGNHTYSHMRLNEHSPRDIIYTLTKAQRRLDEVLGYHYPMQVMRPPYGKATNPGPGSGTRLDAIANAGYSHAILWDVSQTDAAMAVKQVKNGSILLYHTNPKDMKCLDVLIPQLLEKGFVPVTVSELLGMAPVATSTDIPEE